MKRFAFLATLLAASIGWAGTHQSGSGGSGSGCTATTFALLPTCASPTIGTCYTVTDCTAANDCSAGGGSAVEQVVCNGTDYDVQGDGAAGSGDGIPAGGGTELQFRANVSDFGAVANTSVSGDDITFGNGASILASGTATIQATQIKQTTNETGICYDATSEGYFRNADGDACVRDANGEEAFIDGTISHLAFPGYRAFCDPATFAGAEGSTTTTMGIEECEEYLGGLGGGEIRLSSSYNIGDCVAAGNCIDIDHANITIRGIGRLASINCTAATGCTAPVVIKVNISTGAILDNFAILADRDGTTVDGIWNGGASDTDCVDTADPFPCCTGSGAGATCSGVYAGDSVFSRLWIDGDSGDWVAGPGQGVGIRNWGLRTRFDNTNIRWFNIGYQLSGNNTGASNAIEFINSRSTSNNTCITGTFGHYGNPSNGIHDTGDVEIIGGTCESGGSTVADGISVYGGLFTLIGYYFEGLADDAIHGIGSAATQDLSVYSIGSVFSGTGDAIQMDAANTGDVWSVGDHMTSGFCINHQGSGEIYFQQGPDGGTPCTHSYGASVGMVDLSVLAGVGATDEYVLSWEDDTRSLTWKAETGVGGTTVAIEEANAEEEDAVERIDFNGTDFDVSCTAAECDITIATVGSSQITNGSVAAVDVSTDLTASNLAATLTFSDSDLIDMDAINVSSSTEGLLLPQAADCSAGTAEGQICWDTNGDFLSVGTGGSVQTFSAGGFNDTGTQVELATTTDEVVIGGTAARESGKVTIDGDADQAQLVIAGHSTQNAALLIMEADGGTDVLTVAADGSVVATDFTASPSAAPTWGGNDSDFNGAGLEASIAINCPTDGDCDMAFNAKTAGTNTEAFRIDTADAGTQTVVFTAAPTLGTAVVDATELATDSVAADEIAASAVGTAEVNDNTLTASDLADSLDFGGDTSFEIPNAAAPTVNAVGEIAVDTNYWDAALGALTMYDGTNTVGLIGIAGAENCDNNEVPKFVTGGTWTCAADSTGSALGANLTSATNDIVSDNEAIVLAGTTENLILTFTANTATITSGTAVATINHPDGSIPGADLVTASVTATQLGADSVAASELAVLAVEDGDIADGAVDGGTGGEIADASITAADLAADSVDTSEIAANAVGNAEMADNAIQAAEIATSAVGTDEVNDNTLTATDLADSLDFGGDTSFEIPNGTGNTVDTTGEIAIDTTAGQFVTSINGATLGVHHPVWTECAVIEDLAATDDSFEFYMAAQAVTITSVGCRCRGASCATPATFTLEDRGGNAMTITGTNPTCATTGNATFAAVTAGNGLVAGEGLAFDVTNTPTASEEYTICVTLTVDRQ